MLGSGHVGAFCDHHGGNSPCFSIDPDLTAVLQLLKEPPPSVIVQDTRRVHIRNLSTPTHRPNSAERQPLIRRRSFDEYDINPEEDIIPGTPLAGGTVLGIHNLAIVLPQFIVRIRKDLISM